MQNLDIKRATVFSVMNALEYAPHSITSKVISKCSNGNVTAMAFDAGEVLTANSIPFDSLVQVIEGKAEVVIWDSRNALEAGESIIIPAHAPSKITAHGKFKMQSTIMKSGYEV